MSADEPTQADMEWAGEAQDEHFTQLHGPDWAFLPTSAGLRQTQAELTKTLAALTRVERERDWAREVVGMLRRNGEISAQVIRERNAERNRLREDLAAAQTARLATEKERDEARFERDRAVANRRLAVQHRNLADAELASARAELEQLRALNPPDERSTDDRP